MFSIRSYIWIEGYIVQSFLSMLFLKLFSPLWELFLIAVRKYSHRNEKKYSSRWEKVLIPMRKSSRKDEADSLKGWRYFTFANRISRCIYRRWVCTEFHVLKRWLRSDLVRGDAADALCCGCGNTCCVPSESTALYG